MKKYTTVILTLFTIALALPTAADAAVYKNKNIVSGSTLKQNGTAWLCYPLSCSQYFSNNVAEFAAENTLEFFAQTEIQIPKSATDATLWYDYNYATIDTAHTSSLLIAVLDSETEERYLLHTINQPATSMENTWSEKSHDLSDLAGKTVNLVFYGVHDSASSDVQLWVWNPEILTTSKSVLQGTIKNAKGKKVKKAQVTVKNAKTGKVYWKGKTNKKGKFSAKKLPGKKLKVIVKKGETKKTFTQKMKLGIKRKKTYTLR